MIITAPILFNACAKHFVFTILFFFFFFYFRIQFQFILLAYFWQNCLLIITNTCDAYLHTTIILREKTDFPTLLILLNASQSMRKKKIKDRKQYSKWSRNIIVSRIQHKKNGSNYYSAIEITRIVAENKKKIIYQKKLKINIFTIDFIKGIISFPL